MHGHLQQEAQVTTQNKMANSKKRCIGDYKSDSESQDSDSSSRNNKTPKAKKVKNKRCIADFKYDGDSQDSDSSSNNNKKPKAEN